MSNDTPTERFDQQGDPPTDRVTTPDDAEAALAPDGEQRTSRRLIIILAAIGGALLLAVLIVLIVLLTRGDGGTALPTSSATPSASVTPSATPTPTPTPTPTVNTPAPAPPPPSTDVAVDSFTINPSTVDCSSGEPVITIKWSTSNANYIYFGADTGSGDAQTNPFFSESLPASGNSTNDFPDGYRPFRYPCGGSHTYVITAVDSDNNKDTVKITVTG